MYYGNIFSICYTYLINIVFYSVFIFIEDRTVWRWCVWVQAKDTSSSLHSWSGLLLPLCLEIISVQWLRLVNFSFLDEVPLLVKSVKLAQLKEAWAVNYTVDRSSGNYAILTKKLHLAFNPKLLGLLDWDLNLRPRATSALRLLDKC